MSNGVGLYYPHIEIRDVNWLKAALLYWDGGIRRIVPPEVSPDDSDEIQEAVAAGVLIDTPPTDDYLNAVAERFDTSVFPVLESLSKDQLAAIQLYDTSRARNMGVFEDSIHIHKASIMLAERLRDLGLARMDDDWIVMERSMVAVYMTILAEIMSERIESPLVTNSAGFCGLAKTSIFGPLVADANVPARDAVTVLSQLNIGFPSPDSLATCSMRRILDFRRDHASELRRFRTTIEESIRSVVTCPDPNALKDKLADAERAVTTAQQNLNDRVAALRIETLGSAMSLEVPLTGIVATTLAAMHAPLVAPVIAVGTFALWAIERRNSFRAARADAPYRYLQTLSALR